MEVTEQTLTSGAWFQALADGGSVILSGATAPILLAHTAGAEPALDAPAHFITETSLNEPMAFSFDAGVKVYMRAYSQPSRVRVSA